MGHRGFKDPIYREFARIGKAIGSPARMEILDLLAQGEKTVEEVAEQAALGVKNASAHLRTLREARVVEARKSPPHVYYRLAGEDVLGLVRAVQALARERLAEVDRLTRLYLEDRDELEPVPLEELRRRIEAGDVTVLDVRPAGEYRAGHLPSAVSVPVAELERRLGEVPAGREVIAYCRGPYCVYAVEAVELLRRRGYRARRAEVGPADWRLAGHAVSVGGEADPGGRPEILP